jgi:hypothetical protein
MVTVRKLTSDEVTALTEKKEKGESSRSVIAALYDSMLAEYKAGDYVAVALGEGENKPTVRKHITRALARRNLCAKWRRGTADTLKLHVIDPAVGNGHDTDETEG